MLPSSMRLSDDVSIGDWPCFAERRMTVSPSRPRRSSSVEHAPDLAVDEGERVLQHRARHPACAVVHVPAAALASAERGGRQLLGGGDGLEVHAEDAGSRDVRVPPWSKPSISFRTARP